MRVIITRADNEAVALAGKIEQIGCTPLVASMMEIELSDQPLDVSEFQAVITSSANGVRALAQMTDVRDMKLFCIGRPSEKIAESLDFTNTEASIGNFNNMGLFIHKRIDPAGSPLIYLHGENVTGNPHMELKRAGVPAVLKRVYGAKAVDKLPEEVSSEFEKDTPPEIATFFSIRTYKLFHKAAEAEGLLPKLKDTVAVCLSSPVADFARGIRWKKVLVADETTGESVVAKIQEWQEGLDTKS